MQNKIRIKQRTGQISKIFWSKYRLKSKIIGKPGPFIGSFITNYLNYGKKISFLEVRVSNDSEDGLNFHGSVDNIR